MSKIYISASNLKGNTINCDAKSATVLFVYHYLKRLCSAYDVELFILNKEDVAACIEMDISSFNFKLVECSNADIKYIRCCSLPIFTIDNNFCVAGLCSVIRQLIKCCNHKQAQSLLGYKKSSLTACAEISVHTKLCEIDLIKSLEKATDEFSRKGKIEQFPMVLVTLELVLSSLPPMASRKHKRNKHANAKARKYLEGFELTISDLIAVPIVCQLWNLLGESIKSLLPHTSKWRTRMLHTWNVLDILENLSYRIRDHSSTFYDGEGMDGSLLSEDILPLMRDQIKEYRENVKQTTVRTTIKYTNQKVLDPVLEKINALHLQFSCLTYDDKYEPIDWNKIPLHAQPRGGNLPENRLQKKMQQLESMTFFILKIAKPGDTIVDFCCGLGHLGILLAYLLPKCTVILLDNKEGSLEMAKTRVSHLNLNNVTIIQSNVDYFVGKFQVGLALHACGIATDLVISNCIDQKANFVISPCCYGKVRKNHMLTYPRSSLLSGTLSHDEYMILAHSADQTHLNTCPKSSQGESCMDLVDIDRCMKIKEESYNSFMTKMKPTTCTTKHNIIIGILDLDVVSIP